MSETRVIVIGAGAAGLTAAIRAGEAGASVVALNAHPTVGLKILMSGGTRCNVTHASVSERDFFGGSRNVIARVLRAFTAEQAREWFEGELGVPLKLEESGKSFPVSDDAQTVLDALLGAAARAGVEIRAGARAVRLERAGERWRVGVQRIANAAALGAEVRGHSGGAAAGARAAAGGASGGPLAPASAAAAARPAVSAAGPEPTEWLEADRVILASGGLSFPRTGSDGTGYALALAHGHTLVPTVPALTPLEAADPLCRAAQGVTLQAGLALWVDGRIAARTHGSLLVAHFGYSGPPALDLSRHWHRADGQARRVTANLLPGATRESLEREWLAYARRFARRGVRTWLGGQLPERLADIVTTESGLGGAAMSQVPRERRGPMLDALLERDLRVTGTLGYEKAEVTAGGVALDEVNPSTLESRRAPGLYLCGEVLDVEGRLGGFNFQWAWSSGTVAGRAAAGRSSSEPTSQQ